MDQLVAVPIQVNCDLGLNLADAKRKSLCRRIVCGPPFGNTYWVARKLLPLGLMKINAMIEDDEITERVRTGEEAFAAGDRLDVDLSVVQEFDQLTRDYLNKKDRIVRVYGHVHAQRILFEE